MRLKVSYRYLLYGALFGAGFPVLATIILSYQEFGDLSWVNLKTLQSQNILLWIINTAPFFLGLFAFKAGLKQQKINEINAGLEQKIEEQTLGLAQMNQQLRAEIEERKAKEVELIEAKEAAEQGVLVKDQFLSNMSHEIRTPMNGIIGMTDILLNTQLTEEQRGYTSAIDYSAKNLLVIINDILDLSKINAEKLELEKVNFKIGDVFESLRNTLRFKAEDKSIALNIFAGQDIPEKMAGDPVRFNQILLNIAGNAIKFTEKGSVDIHYDLVEETDEGYTIGVKIKDTGIGIKKENIQSVFESFTQANAGIARKFGGTGLGLPISKKLVELHGGELLVDSEYGKGTTFNFTVRFSVPVPESKRSKQGPKIEMVKSERSKIRILVVEDNKINQLVALRFLQRFGFQSELASDGQEAIQMVTERDYDLILMDVQMPVLDGLEATRYIRSKLDGPKRRIKIMAMTASVLSNEVNRCFQAGMDEYIPKPFDPDVLYEKIIQLTGNGQTAAHREGSLATESHGNRASSGSLKRTGQ